MKTITIRISDDMHKKLKGLALEKDMFIQDLILDQLHLLVPNAKREFHDEIKK